MRLVEILVMQGSESACAIEMWVLVEGRYGRSTVVESSVYKLLDGRLHRDRTNEVIELVCDQSQKYIYSVSQRQRGGMCQDTSPPCIQKSRNLDCPCLSTCVMGQGSGMAGRHQPLIAS